MSTATSNLIPVKVPSVGVIDPFMNQTFSNNDEDFGFVFGRGGCPQPPEGKIETYPYRVRSVGTTDPTKLSRFYVKESTHRVFCKYSHKIWDFLVTGSVGGRAY